jgi:hypothetical protein
MEGCGMTDKGRWFRVYAIQLRDHPKFRALTGLELGAWTSLRSEAELRAGAVIADRDEAVLILKRRKIPRPAAMLNRLIDLALFDVDDEGRIHVHDRADHDRAEQSQEQQSHRRDHRRSEGQEGCDWCDVERWDRSHGPHGGWTPVVGGNVDSPQRVERGLPQPTQPSSATANSQPPQPAGEGLPHEDDSATAACRMFLNGGRWLGDQEYVEAWDDMDRRYGKAWVQSEIQPAFQRLHADNPKVKPWALKHAVELACAERVRASELERDRTAAEASRLERERERQKAESATEEDKRRASIMRRAVGLWIKRRPTEPVPTDFDELEAWLNDNESKAAA